MRRLRRDSTPTLIEQLCLAAAAAFGGVILGGILGALVGSLFTRPTDEMGGPAMLFGLIGMCSGLIIGVALPWMLPDGDRRR